MNKNEYSICDECGSEFLKSSSKMMALCLNVPTSYMAIPIVPMILNGRCIYCHWDGSQSEYIKGLKGNG